MKKLYRSKTNKKIAGVCGGIAEYLNIEVTATEHVTREKARQFNMLLIFIIFIV